LQPWGWNQSRLLYHLSRWFVKSIKRVFRPSSWDKEFLAFLKDTDPMQPRRVPTDWVGAMDEWIKEFKQLPISQFPLHIIQGNNDKTLDWVYNLERFKHKFPSSSLSVIDTANHHLVNESEALRQEIFAALKL
jgi:alpha-beta hydrolase superfamily lysophospholipase